MALKCPEFRVGFSDILLQRPPPVYIDVWIRNCLCAAEGGMSCPHCCSRLPYVTLKSINSTTVVVLAYSCSTPVSISEVAARRARLVLEWATRVNSARPFFRWYLRLPFRLKLFKTSNIETVEFCQDQFGFYKPNIYYGRDVCVNSKVSSLRRKMIFLS